MFACAGRCLTVVQLGCSVLLILLKYLQQIWPVKGLRIQPVSMVGSDLSLRGAMQVVLSCSTSSKAVLAGQNPATSSQQQLSQTH